LRTGFPGDSAADLQRDALAVLDGDWQMDSCSDSESDFPADSHRDSKADLPRDLQRGFPRDFDGDFDGTSRVEVQDEEPRMEDRRTKTGECRRTARMVDGGEPKARGGIRV
jgi:hypothetical protein